VSVTAALDERQRRAIERCLELMCGGMHRYQQTAGLQGVPRTADLDEYCYFVAGVVGEMLTELFCGHSPAIDARGAALRALAVSFAQGLQMTNILKDTWEDRARGVCWLPQEVFTRHGINLGALNPGAGGAGFDAGMRELIGVAHAHLRNALAYTLLIPESETGIRRFCLWAVGLAVLTLRKIESTPGFTGGAQVKVTRSSVAMVRLLTGAALHSNWMLRRLFDLAAAGLPLAPVASSPVAHGPPAAA
jgi:farnesyl-diphosphate farnesyltransferase